MRKKFLIYGGVLFMYLFWGAPLFYTLTLVGGGGTLLVRWLLRRRTPGYSR